MNGAGFYIAARNAWNVTITATSKLRVSNLTEQITDIKRFKPHTDQLDVDLIRTGVT